MEVVYTIGYYAAIVATFFVFLVMMPRYVYKRYKCESLREAFYYEVHVLLCLIWLTVLPVLMITLKPYATWQA